MPLGDPRRVLDAIIDSSDDAIFTTDLDGVVLTWNRGARRMFGYAEGEIVGRSIAMLVPDDRIDEVEETPRRIRAGEQVDHNETAYQAKGGRLIDVSINIFPIKDSDGRVIGASAIAHDITEQKRVERALRSSEARWRAIIKSAVDAIIVINSRGRIESFNPAAERLFGHLETEILGRNVNMLMPSPYHEEHDGYITRYLTTGEQKIIGIGREVTALRKDGTTFPVHLSVGELTVEGDRKFTGIIHDLSARVAIERQLREQSALTKLGEMAAVVAHEVKNPLTGIRGAIQVIGSRLPPESKDAAVVKEIIARVDALNELMKDLLLFARPPQLKIVPVDLIAVLRAVVDNVKLDPANRDLHIEVQGASPSIMGDAELLKIVLQNLILNSAHATQGRGSVRVSLEFDDRGSRVVIADNGPGIPPDVRDRLFTPFFTTKSRGTGLGLSTAKRLVEAHAGSIAIDCPPDGGTVVTLQFPVQVV